MDYFFAECSNREFGNLNTADERKNMENKHYSVEDPIEHSIRAVQSVIRSDTRPSAEREDPSDGWRNDGLLANLGPVVAYERPDNSMALSTWDGPSTSVWAKFDVEPAPELVYMRKHMVEAVSIDQPRPPGFIKVICFAR